MTIALLILFAIITALDAWITLRILAAGGRELNPLVRKAMDKFGNVKGMALVKIPTLILVAFLPWYVLLPLVVLYAGVVIFNLKQLKG